MQKQLFRLILVPALLCAILGAGFLSTAGIARAATLQASAPQVIEPAYTPGKNCPYGDAEVDNTSNDYYCFATNKAYGGQVFGNIYILNTGLHTVAWNWEDCHGGVHYASKAPRTIVVSSTSPGAFAGCTYMALVYNVIVT